MVKGPEALRSGCGVVLTGLRMCAGCQLHQHLHRSCRGHGHVRLPPLSPCASEGLLQVRLAPTPRKLAGTSFTLAKKHPTTVHTSCSDLQSARRLVPSSGVLGRCDLDHVVDAEDGDGGLGGKGYALAFTHRRLQHAHRERVLDRAGAVANHIFISSTPQIAHSPGTTVARQRAWHGAQSNGRRKVVTHIRFKPEWAQSLYFTGSSCHHQSPPICQLCPATLPPPQPPSQISAENPFPTGLHPHRLHRSLFSQTHYTHTIQTYSTTAS